MSGGLLQLVAYGAQDLYLTGNPQITWWKLVYRRYTNFAIESIPQTFSGDPDFGKKVTCTIARNGDLINKIYLQVVLPAVAAIGTSVSPLSRVRWVDRVGHALIQSYELLIGGQSIDKQYGEWLEIWAQLSLPPGKLGAYNRMIGHTTAMHSDATQSQYTLYIPLQFWFCRNAGLSLPLIALQYHDIKINVQFNPLSALIVQGQLVPSVAGSSMLGTYIDDSPTTTVPQVTPVTYSGSISDATLYIDYVYLDTDERRRFAQVSHEYLVDQLQYTGPETVTTTANNITLSLNHPVRALVWVVQSSQWVAANVNQTFNYTTSLQDRTSSTTAFDAPVDLNDASGGGPLASCTLVLNGKQRFETRLGDYFNLVQPYQSMPNCPSSPGIYVYAFALSPSEAQPSGSCNFSRIDSAVLQLQFSATFLQTVATVSGAGASGATTSGVSAPAEVRIYAINHNVLRVMSGMAGLAYSN